MPDTNFPANFDDNTSLPEPTAANNQDQTGFLHADQHYVANRAVKALQQKLGKVASTPSANVVLLGTGAGQSAWAQVTNAYIAGTAGITVSKLAAGSANTVLQSDGSANSWAQIANAHIASNAGIAVSKLATGSANTVLQSDGSANSWAQIANAHIAGTAGIMVSKLAAGGTANRLVGTTDGATMAMQQIVNAMVASNAAIDLNKLGTMKYCMMQTDTTPDQSISNTTWTDINFINELDDPFNMHSGTDTFITIPETGLWMVAVTLLITQNLANARYMLGLPGLIGAVNFITANNPSHDPYTLFYATVGKIYSGSLFRVQIWHNNGSTIQISNAYQPKYVIAKVGNI